MSRVEELYWCAEIPGGYELTGTLEHLDGRIEAIVLEDGTRIETGAGGTGCFSRAPPAHQALFGLIFQQISSYCHAELNRAAGKAYDRADRQEYA